MADDIDISKFTPDQLKKLSEAADMMAMLRKRNDELSDSLRRSADPARRFEQNFGRLGKRVADVEKKFESLDDVLREQIDSIKKAAAQVGSLQSQFHDAGGALTSFLGKLKQTISVTNVYNRMMEEMRQGQKAFAASAYATTDAIGTAGKQSQRFVDAVHDAYANARDVAAEYGLEVEKVRQVSTDLMDRFKGQLAAQADMSGSLSTLTKDTIKWANFMGVDAAHAAEFLENRMRFSNKTIGEAQREMLGVARQADMLTQSLNKLGDRFMKTGRISRQEFIGIIKNMQGEFQHGVMDAEAYSAAVVKSIEGAAKAGMTSSEQAAVAGGFGRLMSSLQKVDNVFAMRMASNIDAMEGRLDQITNQQTRKRVEAVLERTKGEADITRWRELVGAMRGDSQASRMILDDLVKATNGNYGQLTAYMQNVAGMEPYMAGTLTELIATHKLQDSMAKVTPKTKEEEEQHREQLDVFKTKFDDLMKAGYTPQSLQYQMAKKMYEVQQKLYKLLENNPILLMGILAGVQLVAARLLFGGGGAGGGLLSKIFGGGAAAAPALAPAAGAMAPAIGAPAAAVAPTAAKVGFGSRILGAGGALLGGVKTVAGGLLLGKVITDAITGAFSAKTTQGAILGGISGITGVTFGRQIDKSVGKWMGLGETAKRPELGGKDSSISGALSRNELFGAVADVGAQWAQGLGNIFGFDVGLGKGAYTGPISRVRGMATPETEKESKLLTASIEKARKNWDKLSPVQRDYIEKQEKYNEQLKHHIKVSKEGIAASIKQTEYLQKTFEGRRESIAGRIRAAEGGGEGFVGLRKEDLMKVRAGLKTSQDIAAFQSLLTDPEAIAKRFTRSQRRDLKEILSDPEFTAKLFGGGKEGERAAERTEQTSMIGEFAGLGGMTEMFARQMVANQGRLQVGLPPAAAQQMADRRQPNINITTGTEPAAGGNEGTVTPFRPDATGVVKLPVQNANSGFVLVDVNQMTVATQQRMNQGNNPNGTHTGG